MKTSLAFIFIAIFGLSFNARADLSQVFSPMFGDGPVTWDSSQNLYWLSPALTVGKSYNQISELLATDARYSNFRFATVEELGILFTSVGIPDINTYGTGINGTPANVPGVTTLQSFLGVTYSFYSLYETAGFIGSPYVSHINGLTVAHLGDIVIRNNVPTSNGPVTFAYAATNLSSLTLSSGYEGVGSWLVSSAPGPAISSIPEPAGWKLMVLGFIMLLLFSRNRILTLRVKHEAANAK